MRFRDEHTLTLLQQAFHGFVSSIYRKYACGAKTAPTACFAKVMTHSSRNLMNNPG